MYPNHLPAQQKHQLLQFFTSCDLPDCSAKELWRSEPPAARGSCEPPGTNGLGRSTGDHRYTEERVCGGQLFWTVGSPSPVTAYNCPDDCTSPVLIIIKIVQSSQSPYEYVQTSLFHLRQTIALKNAGWSWFNLNDRGFLAYEFSACNTTSS